MTSVAHTIPSFSGNTEGDRCRRAYPNPDAGLISPSAANQDPLVEICTRFLLLVFTATAIEPMQNSTRQGGKKTEEGSSSNLSPDGIMWGTFWRSG